MARTPSPALVVATLALVVAIGGTAWAAALPRNSVGNVQLKRNAVTGAKVKNASLTGADIDLTRLGTVPQATHAATAGNAATATSATSATSATTAANVGGIEFRRIHFRAAPMTPDVLVFDEHGIAIRAQCQAASALEVSVATAADHVVFNGSWVGTGGDPPGGVAVADLGVGDGFFPFLNNASSFTGAIHFALPNGTDIAIDWHSASNSAGQAGCLFTGVATISRA